MRAVDIIMKKRGNRASKSIAPLSKEEIDFLISGYVNGTIPEYQISSFLMAVYFNGMTFEETGFLTDAMLHSGDTYDLHGKDAVEGLKGPFVDKHSTGGVGDKISLPLAPIVASLGVQIPMMSGRALGHTGGTLDKLESIEGYNVNLSKKDFATFIAKNGFGMTGQTKEIVPADRLLYALRDVTGTVESVPLITSSILSKKVAEGSDALVFDVKCGNGAFMKNLGEAEELASFLVNTAKSMGKKATALITNMNTPLGEKVGNFLEIEETLDILEGKGPEDTTKLTYELAAEMLFLGEKAKTKDEAYKMIEETIKNGNALKCFIENVKMQGGNAEKMMADRNKKRSPYKTELFAEKDGFLTLNAFKTGLAGVNLGVGRNKTDEKVFADSGMIIYKKTGDEVKKGDLLMDIFGKDDSCLVEAKKILSEAYSYSENKPSDEPLIFKVIK